jgi:two-component system, OmpR family, sensor histidine kinase KdpD
MTPTTESKPASEGQVGARLLVCLGPNPSADKLIRTVKEMADTFHTEWFAVYVEDPGMLRQPEKVRNQAVYNLRLAEELGAKTVTLRGSSIAAEIINFARQRKITRIIAGKPTRSRWQSILWPSPVDELVRRSGEIDISVITGKIGGHKEPPVLVPPQIIRRAEYEMAIFYFILATGLSFLMYPYFNLSNLIMVYLVGVMVTAIHCGRGPSILNSVLSVLGFDFFFVPPRFTFAVEENHYILTFMVMFLVALVISHFTVLIRRQAEAARLQERQTAAMLALSQHLAGARGLEAILQVAVQSISEIFECNVVVLLPNGTDRLRVSAGDSTAVFHKDFLKELNVAQETYKTGQMSGWGTLKSAGTEIIHVPLQAAGDTLGVLSLRPSDPYAENWLLPEQMRLRFLESLAKQAAMALEVEKLQKAA